MYTQTSILQNVFIALTSLLMLVNSVKNADVINFTLTPTNETTRTFQQLANLSLSIQNSIIVNIDPSENVRFFIIQLHTFNVNVMLSYTPTFLAHTYVNGTNIGLVQIIENGKMNYTFFAKSESYNATLLSIITTYPSEAPIPGGCSMTFDTEIAPYQLLYVTDTMIRIDVQEPSISGHVCEENVVELEMYHLFLDAWDFDEISYITAINKMLNVTNIRKWASKVPIPYGHTNLRRYYNNYAGVGSVFVAIATYGNFSSAYVPTISYGCNISQGMDSCFGKSHIYWKVMGPIVLIAGIAMLLLGRAIPLITAFFVASVIGIEFIHLPILLLFNTDSMYITVPLGLGFALALVLLLKRINLIFLLNAVAAGYAIASIIFFSASVGDATIFQNNWNFWGVFIAVMAVVMVLSICSSFLYGGLSTLLIGVLLLAIGINYYWGGILYYMALNNFRRATVTNFSLAIIDPPIQYQDQLSVVISVIVGTISYVLQIKSEVPSGEMQPLLG